MKMRLVPKGTLLLSFKLTLGRLCYAGRNLFTNEAIAALHDIDATRVNKEFLYWYLTYFDWVAAVAGDQKIKGKTLNKAKLKVLPVMVPPLEQQKRIVAVLDQGLKALDRTRAHAEQSRRDASEIFDSVLADTQQQRVVTTLDALLEKTKRLEDLYIRKYIRKLADIAALRQSLLQKAFAGELT